MTALRWYRIETYVESCGGFGCRGQERTRIVAATSPEQAAQLVADYEERIESGPTEIEIPSLDRKRSPFVLA